MPKDESESFQAEPRPARLVEVGEANRVVVHGALVWDQDPGEYVEEGGLSGPRWAGHGDDSAGVAVQVDAAQGFGQPEREPQPPLREERSRPVLGRAPTYRWSQPCSPFYLGL